MRKTQSLIKNSVIAAASPKADILCSYFVRVKRKNAVDCIIERTHRLSPPVSRLRRRDLDKPKSILGQTGDLRRELSAKPLGFVVREPIAHLRQDGLVEAQFFDVPWHRVGGARLIDDSAHLGADFRRIGPAIRVPTPVYRRRFVFEQIALSHCSRSFRFVAHYSLAARQRAAGERAC